MKTVFVVVETNRQGIKTTLEMFLTEAKARESAKAKGRFGFRQGKTYAVEKREVPKDTPMPIWA